MDSKHPLKKVQDFIKDTLRYPKHLRWNREAVKGADRNDEIFNQIFYSALPDTSFWQRYNFIQQGQFFANWLRQIQEMLIFEGYRPNITYITEPQVFKAKGVEYFLIGYMYPTNGLIADIFKRNFSNSMPQHYDGGDTLNSALDTVSSNFMPVVARESNRYCLANALDYKFVIFYIGPTQQLEIEDNSPYQNNIILDYWALNTIHAEMEWAFKQLTPGITKDDNPDPQEA